MAFSGSFLTTTPPPSSNTEETKKSPPSVRAHLLEDSFHLSYTPDLKSSAEVSAETETFFDQAIPLEEGSQVLGTFLELLFQQPSRAKKELPSKEYYTGFQLTSEATVSIRDFLIFLVSKAEFSIETGLMSLVLMDRLYQKYHHFTIDRLSMHRLLLAACVLVDKIHSDVVLINSDWAMLGSLTRNDLNWTELELFEALSYNAFVSVKEYVHLFSLVSHILAAQPRNSLSQPSPQMQQFQKPSEAPLEEDKEDCTFFRVNDLRLWSPPFQTKWKIPSRNFTLQRMVHSLGTDSVLAARDKQQEICFTSNNPLFRDGIEAVEAELYSDHLDGLETKWEEEELQRKSQAPKSSNPLVQRLFNKEALSANELTRLRQSAENKCGQLNTLLDGYRYLGFFKTGKLPLLSRDPVPLKPGETLADDVPVSIFLGSGKVYQTGK